MRWLTQRREDRHKLKLIQAALDDANRVRSKLFMDATPKLAFGYESASSCPITNTVTAWSGLRRLSDVSTGISHIHVGSHVFNLSDDAVEFVDKFDAGLITNDDIKRLQ